MTFQHFWEIVKHDANLESLFFRRALRSAIVVFLSILIYHVFSLTQGYWVTMTAVIVGQATVGATLRKSFQRFWGTLLGVTIASLLLLFIRHHFTIEILVLVFLFLTYFFNPYTNLINYGFVVIPMSIMVIFLIALTTPEKINHGIIYTRFYDTAIGAALGMLGAFFIFPNKVKHEFKTSKQYLEKQLADYFYAIMEMFLNFPDADKQAKAKKMQVEDALLSDHQFYLEGRYELHFASSTQAEEKLFIEISERMAQRLFSLHQHARFHLSLETLEKMRSLLIQIRDTGYDFLHEENVLPDNLNDLLKKLQKTLAEITQKQDNMLLHWHDIAPFAILHFVLMNLIQDIAKVRDEQRHTI